MTKTLTILFHLALVHILTAQPVLTAVGTLPEAVSNNALCEGYVNNVPYLFSFGGIDSTKKYSGIHLRSFRYNLRTGESSRIPDLPDTRGKIASAASSLGDIIYIMGGYHVFSNGSERSSCKVHRYDTANNVFLADGKDIPKAIDDHVQVVWRDSLIFLITGWSNTANVPNVQIYNPSTDTWLTGTSVPNNHDYKSFGASGAILKDTIYYFGGAKSVGNFSIQNQLRKGIIDPNDPTNISWSVSTPEPITNGYRMASTVVGHEVHWIGGSQQTYNYDGIAYNGSGGVAPSNRDLFFKNGHWNTNIVHELPMDLRGIASINDSTKYLAGGMLSNQRVTNKVYKLVWPIDLVDATYSPPKLDCYKIYPNPSVDKIIIENNICTINATLKIYNISGQKILEQYLSNNKNTISTLPLPQGIYFLSITSNKGVYTQKMIKSIP